MNANSTRQSPLALILPFCGIVAGYAAAKSAWFYGVQPFGGFAIGLLILFVFSVCGLFLAIIDVRTQHRASDLAIAAILANGFFLVPILCIVAWSLLSLFW